MFSNLHFKQTSKIGISSQLFLKQQIIFLFHSSFSKMDNFYLFIYNNMYLLNQPIVKGGTIFVQKELLDIILN